MKRKTKNVKTKEAKATWGKIKNYDLLSPEHKKLLNEELNFSYRPITPRTFEANVGEYFHQKNVTIGY